MIFPKNFEQKIGFNQIREMLHAYCISKMGAERIDAMAFMTGKADIDASLEQTHEFVLLMRQGLPFPVRDYHDLRDEFDRIRIEGTFISLDRLFEMKPSLNVMEQVLRFRDSEAAAEYPRLSALMKGVGIDRRLVAEVNRLVDDKGEMPDNASPELLEIRRDLLRKQGGMEKRIRQIMAEAKTAGWVDQKSEITIRNGRMVIPVKAGDKRALKGFVHDESATGQTVYIEPSEIVETSNEIRELEYAEHREINRILLTFTKLLRPSLPELHKAWDLLGALDFIRAKALLCQEMEGVNPIVRDVACFDWRKARHPLLEQKLKKQNRDIVPLDLALDHTSRILVISGPNAGGKSVCLKTTGLIQYMLQCGLSVPMAPDSECGIFHDLFIDIGDEQSLENDLSTYSSHLLNMKAMLEHVGERSFFLIDEFGTGTEPQLGGAIAEAILLELNKKKVFGIVTTHYANLKLLADNNEGIANGAMLFDTKFMQPMYIMVIGKPGSSFAFEIAKKTGLPKHVLDAAASITGSEHIRFEQQLQQLEIDKKNIRKKERELQIADDLLNEVVTKYKRLLAELEEKKKQYLRNAANEARQLIEKANKQIERTIREIKEAQAEKEKTKTLRKELDVARKEITAVAEALNNPVKGERKEAETLKPGDMVCIDEMEVVGEILVINDTDVTIQFDSVKLRTTTDKLRKVSRSEGRKTIRKWQSGLADELNAKAEHFDLTLDLRGKRADEAMEAVEHYIDEAQLLSIKEVAILHGKGNGILRKLVREYLSHLCFVERFCDASLETGGSGITKVYFK